MLRAYRRQAEEISATKLSMATLADERDALRSQLSMLEESYTEVQAQSARAASENAQLLLDLHAFESQNDALVRQLEATDGDARAALAERSAAEQQLASTQLVMGGLERSREVLQRDSASASRAVHALRAQLEEADKDRAILRQQLELSRAAVQNLEAIAADLRTKAMPAATAAALAVAGGVSGEPAKAPAVEGGSEGVSGGAASQPSAAEMELLRQQHAAAAAEVAALSRALSTATFERDVAIKGQEEVAAREESLHQTIASQTAVIRTLDDERAAALRAAGAPSQ